MYIKVHRYRFAKIDSDDLGNDIEDSIEDENPKEQSLEIAYELHLPSAVLKISCR